MTDKYPTTKPQLMYVAVKALIFDDQNRLLLLKKVKPNFWDIPGGRIDPGENIIEALKRELREELPGFKVYRIERLVAARKKDGPIADGNELFLTYFLVTSTSEENKLTLSPEHSEHKFFSLEEIGQLEHPLNLVYGGIYRKAMGEIVDELNEESVVV